jgi:NAD(P)-dependent dehydrogenase (short-subunit alcohol dehydrogenase family)
MNFENKVAVVTGAGGGLGLAIIEKFARGGAAIVALDYSQKMADAAAEKVRSLTKQKVLAIQFDVADHHSVAKAFTAIDQEFKQIDILVNCAGVREVQKIYDLDPEEWRRVIDINLNGPFYCAREAVLRMRKTGGGSIVNIASVAGMMGLTHRPAYNSSKHGIIGLTRNLSLDCAADGIRVNAVAPGLIRTPLTDGYYKDPEFIKGLNEVVPMGAQGGSPEDIADAIAFLCSSEAKFVNGIVLPVDGGWAASKGYTTGSGSAQFTSAKNQT